MRPDRVGGSGRLRRIVCTLAALLGATASIAAAAQEARRAPDALILVQPHRDQAIVAVVFPGIVAHARVRGRFDRLATAGGWRLMGPPEVTDEEGVTDPRFGPERRLGKQTSGTAMFASAPQWVGAGLNLQPYLVAFGDLDRIEVLFLADAVPAYAGLRDYRADGVAVTLTRAGGPYRYTITIDDHKGPLPTLPATQPRAPAGAARPARSGGVLAILLPAVIAGTATGLLVLVALLVRRQMTRGAR